MEKIKALWSKVKAFAVTVWGKIVVLTKQIYLKYFDADVKAFTSKMKEDVAKDISTLKATLVGVAEDKIVEEKKKVADAITKLKTDLEQKVKEEIAKKIK